MSPFQKKGHLTSKDILLKIGVLTRANANIGYYDHLRYGELKKQKKRVNKKRLYTASKKARANNELRSQLKNELDNLLTLFINHYKKK